ncbi:MAG TPA: tetrathionate reductase family octaheme c-type cytochrome [Planctomycetes bacterium]|nr:tetrathionate reductase family octaheme c-type cytochrome [Planctomycetota bacterium]
MRAQHYLLLLVIVFAVMTAATAMVRYERPPEPTRSEAWERMPDPPAHVDHTAFFVEPFEDGPAVTSACLQCHEKEARDFMHTQHWRWTGEAVQVPGHDGEVEIGKKNLINNFCIGIESNWPKCTSCHAGYGWQDESFDFEDETRIDCLVCHDQSGQYTKGVAGNPNDGVDLLAAAQSVARPNRTNCGICHFNGGGGDAVKHGDLDQTMYFPTRDIDVHMGGNDFACVDCHRTEDHEIHGRSMSVSVEDKDGIRCTECHDSMPHQSDRLNAHTRSLACQTCHIPNFAVREPTKMDWRWSEAGQDLPIQDKHVYMKIKGRFIYAREVVPEYHWYNGTANRYLKGDTFDPSEPLKLNEPRGDIHDPTAKIWPFKVHRGNQPYDVANKTLLIPKTVGKGGYWTDFNWDQAMRLAAPITGIPYSGQMGFAETMMYWPLSHMVAPKEKALQCADCHGDGGRMPWRELGYDGDPAERGGRPAGARTLEEGGAR